MKRQASGTGRQGERHGDGRQNELKIRKLGGTCSQWGGKGRGERDMPRVNNSQAGQAGRTGRETEGMLEKGLYPRTGILEYRQDV
jgi:hypothetical protein